MFKFIVSFLATTLLMTSVAPPAINAEVKSNQSEQNTNMELIYHEETDLSLQSWYNEALPIGNGDMGAKIFGGVNKERIQLNEKTLWTGGPSDYGVENNGGNFKGKHKYIPEIRDHLDKGNIEAAKNLAEQHLVGPYTREYGRYLPLADILLEFDDHGTSEDYVKKLSLEDAIMNVSYTSKGTNYDRESFASYIDDVLVFKLDAEGEKKLSFKVDLIDNEDTSNNKMNDNATATRLKEHEFFKDSQVDIIEEDGNIKGLLLHGIVKDNNRKFAGYLKIHEIQGTDAKVSKDKDGLKIDNADKVIFTFNAATDYELAFPDYRKENYEPKVEVRQHLDSIQKNYNELKEAHIKDYHAQYQNFSLNIGAQPENYDTKKLLNEYKQGKDSNYLEALLMQYGRYLLISSSRSGQDNLPANLQGVWNAVTNPAWNSDYHLNINLQMNYWPAYNTNMVDTSLPLIEYIDDLRESGRIAAKEYGGLDGDRGWLTHTQNTPFGWTTPGWDYYWGWSPASNAWIMQNVYEHYEFTKDIDFLNEKIYPMLEDTVYFWNEFLYYDEVQDRYVSSPAYSPEHGPISHGNTYDQSLIYQLFYNYIEASEVVDTVDSKLLSEVEEKIEKLRPLEIGEDGQIKEWYEEGRKNHYENGDRIPSTQDNHRHISELVGLFPGTIFQEEKYLDAAKVNLNLRGDGGTGWAKANKVNMWARLKDGERAHKLLNEQIQGNILNNLWNTHPPYQLDGNSGAASGIAEMLLQSHEEYIELLPAVPQKWKDGSFEGMLARGNYEFDVSWENEEIKDVEVLANKGGVLKLAFEDAQNYIVKINGEIVDHKIISNDKIAVHTEENDRVTIEGKTNENSQIKNVLAKWINKEAVISWDEVNEAEGYTVAIYNPLTKGYKVYETKSNRIGIEKISDLSEIYIRADFEDKASSYSQKITLPTLELAYDLDIKSIIDGNFTDNKILPLYVTEDGELSTTDYQFTVTNISGGDTSIAKIEDGQILVFNEEGTVKVTAQSTLYKSLKVDKIFTNSEIESEFEMIDDRDAAIKYGSHWHNWNESGRYKDTEKYIENVDKNDPEAKLTYKFIGTGIDIYGIKSRQLGKMYVQIDDEDPVLVDTYNESGTQLKAHLYSIQDLQETEHTLTIYPETNNKISLDFFKVYSDYSFAPVDRDLLKTILEDYAEDFTDEKDILNEINFILENLNILEDSELVEKFNKIIKDIHNDVEEKFNINIISEENININGPKNAVESQFVHFTALPENIFDNIYISSTLPEKLKVYTLPNGDFAFRMPSEDVEIELTTKKVEEGEEETEEKAKRAAVLVDRMIYRLPNVRVLTVEDTPLVEAARSAYEDLSDQAKMNVRYLGNLELREDRLEILNSEGEVADEFAVRELQRRIYRLPSARNITLADAEQVEAIRVKYDKLNDASKGIFSPQYLKNLELREDKLEELENNE